MQFAYQFPERCERLVLVSSGGLGPRGPPAAARRRAARRRLRAAAARLAPRRGRRPRHRRRARAGPAAPRAATSTRSPAASPRSTTPARARPSCTRVRAVIEPAGQRVNAGDRLYLAAALPTLIVWGERDSIIPLSHGAGGARGDAGQPARGVPRRGAHAARRRPRSASPRVLADFCDRNAARAPRRRSLGAAADGGGRPRPPRSADGRRSRLTARGNRRRPAGVEQPCAASLLLPLAAAVLLLAAPAAWGGGWATVGLSSTPDGLGAGHALEGGHHGPAARADAAGRHPSRADDPRRGTERVFDARPTGEPGVYRAAVVFPRAGRWEYEVRDGFIDETPHLRAGGDRRAGAGAARPVAAQVDPRPGPGR